MTRSDPATSSISSQKSLYQYRRSACTLRNCWIFNSSLDSSFDYISPVVTATYTALYTRYPYSNTFHIKRPPLAIPLSLLLHSPSYLLSGLWPGRPRLGLFIGLSQTAWVLITGDEGLGTIWLMVEWTAGGSANVPEVLYCLFYFSFSLAAFAIYRSVVLICCSKRREVHSYSIWLY